MTFETKMQVMNSSAFRKINDLSGQMQIDTKSRQQPNSFMPKNKLLQDSDDLLMEK